MELRLNWVLLGACQRLFVLVLEVLEYLLLVEMLLHNLLWKNDVAQISDEVRIDAHLDHLCLRTEHINQLDAHSSHIERGILAQIEQNL